MSGCCHGQLTFGQQIKKSVIAALLGVPLFIFGLFGFDLVFVGPWQWMWAVIGVLTLIVMIYSGKQFFVGAWQSLKKGQANMNTLIAVATGPAWLYSMALVIDPHWLPLYARHLHFDAPLMVMAFIVLGGALEARASAKAQRTVAVLKNSAKNQAHSDNIDALLTRVQAVQQQQTRISKLVDKIAAWFAPLVIAIAIIAAAFWGVYGPLPHMVYTVEVFMAVLLIACPCALGMAVPMSLAAGSSVAAESAIYSMNVDAMDIVRRAKSVVVLGSVVGFDLLEMALKKRGVMLVREQNLDAVDLDSLPKPLVLISDAIFPEHRAADCRIQIGWQADINQADVVIDDDSLEKAAHLFRLSRRVFRNMHQNLGAALIYNVLGLLLAAGGSYLFFGVMLSPILAGLLMACSSLGVVLNANRLYLQRLA